ncbi:hypothetical protein Dda_7002 [Drechslerella dactyloides]|uniref:Uncharacterized protein n=1 Tax=Drechslerella dactyloides TaxID=74499 RepID=A0AAD6IXA8_DREDA|nr:hypothetical protein Dda_7002 [Drechslerella dactyloides]
MMVFGGVLSREVFRSLVDHAEEIVKNNKENAEDCALEVNPVLAVFFTVGNKSDIDKLGYPKATESQQADIAQVSKKTIPVDKEETIEAKKEEKSAKQSIEE